MITLKDVTQCPSSKEACMALAANGEGSLSINGIYRWDNGKMYGRDHYQVTVHGEIAEALLVEIEAILSPIRTIEDRGTLSITIEEGFIVLNWDSYEAMDNTEQWSRYLSIDRIDVPNFTSNNLGVRKLVPITSITPNLGVPATADS